MPRPPDCNAALVLADGTVFLGPRRRRKRVGGRGGLLQHRDHRLSGDPDRPLLCRPDHHLHLPPYRQCRSQPGRHRNHDARRARSRPAHSDHRAGKLPRHPVARYLAQIQWADRHFGGRHASADPAHPRSRTAERRHRATTRKGGSISRALRRGRSIGPVSKGWTSPRKSPAAKPTSGPRRCGTASAAMASQRDPRYHVVAIDYGAKRNILRMLAAHGCRVTVVPATASTEDVLRHRPDGIFLSNGPGDPAATGAMRCRCCAT